jgi:diguanylate cyclase (GGDEF)-like protein
MSCTTCPADLAARYGGEEFVCILPETDITGVITIAEKIRLGILDLAIPNRGSNVSKHVTVSLGVLAVKYSKEHSIEDILTQVDTLLYKAKSSGRNRVEFAGILM